MAYGGRKGPPVLWQEDSLGKSGGVLNFTVNQKRPGTIMKKTSEQRRLGFLKSDKVPAKTQTSS